MATQLYNSYKVLEGNGGINLDTDVIKVMLVTNVYVPNIDTHDFRDDVTNEVVGAGYVSGGKILANIVVAIDTVNDRATLDGDDIQWAASTITAAGAVIYRNVGTPATDDLIGFLDFGGDIVSDNGDFDIAWNAIGFLTLT